MGIRELILLTDGDGDGDGMVEELPIWQLIGMEMGISLFHEMLLFDSN
jgi:hypothetical protein